MIKKLKIRLVIIMLLLLVSVLTVILSSMYFIMYKQGENQAIDQMKRFAEEKSFDAVPFDMWAKEGVKAEGQFHGGAGGDSIKISIDDTGNITGIQGPFDIDENEILPAVSHILSLDNDTGKISVDDDQMRYYYNIDGDGSVVLVLKDMQNELAVLSNLLSTLLLVGLAGVAVLFFISWFLAAKAIKPVETAWEKQKRFIADASHELKTPLTVIAANTDVVLEAKSDTVQNQEKWLHNIKEETNIMSGLVASLLYLAKSDTENDRLVFEPFDLSKCVSKAVISFEAVVFEHKKMIESEISDDVFIKADENKFYRMFCVLIDNAVRYSVEDSKINIKLVHKKDKIVFSVNNKGTLIKKENLERIFERFFREDDSREKQTGGFGLGLSIAKAVADSYKCELFAKSSEVCGNTFFVVIPKHIIIN